MISLQLVWQLPVESISCAGLVTTQDNPQVTALDNNPASIMISLQPFLRRVVQQF